MGYYNTPYRTSIYNSPPYHGYYNRGYNRPPQRYYKGSYRGSIYSNPPRYRNYKHPSYRSGYRGSYNGPRRR